MTSRLRAIVPVLAVLATAMPAAGVIQADDPAPAEPGNGGCRARFDRAVDTYVRSTHERDAAGFASVLHQDVTAIFADGEVLYGKDRTMGFIEAFFADPDWTQSFDELTREVRGCQTGFVLFDSVFTPAPGADPIPLVIGVTFTFEHGRWLALQNQDSRGPAYTTAQSG